MNTDTHDPEPRCGCGEVEGADVHTGFALGCGHAFTPAQQDTRSSIESAVDDCISDAITSAIVGMNGGDVDGAIAALKLSRDELLARYTASEERVNAALLEALGVTFEDGCYEVPAEPMPVVCDSLREALKVWRRINADADDARIATLERERDEWKRSNEIATEGYAACARELEEARRSDERLRDELRRLQGLIEKHASAIQPEAEHRE